MYHKKLVREYYLRPRYILKMLLQIRSFVQLKNYIKAGLRILNRK